MKSHIKITTRLGISATAMILAFQGHSGRPSEPPPSRTPESWQTDRRSRLRTDPSAGSRRGWPFRPEAA